MTYWTFPPLVLIASTLVPSLHICYKPTLSMFYVFILRSLWLPLLPEEVIYFNILSPNTYLLVSRLITDFHKHFIEIRSKFPDISPIIL